MERLFVAGDLRKSCQREVGTESHTTYVLEPEHEQPLLMHAIEWFSCHKDAHSKDRDKCHDDNSTLE